MDRIISKKHRLCKAAGQILTPALVIAAMFCLAGCSVSIPIAGLLDNDNTGSTKHPSEIAQAKPTTAFQSTASVSPSKLTPNTSIDLAMSSANAKDIDMTPLGAISPAGAPQ